MGETRTVQLDVSRSSTRIALDRSDLDPFALRLSRKPYDAIGTEIRNQDLGRACRIDLMGMGRGLASGIGSSAFELDGRVARQEVGSRRRERDREDGTGRVLNRRRV